MDQLDDRYIVVTGGAGLIGSCLIRHLNDKGIKKIVVFDDLGHDLRWKNLVGKNFVDLFHFSTIFSWLEGKEKEIRGFIHLGACSDTTCTDANYLLENNTRFSIKLAEYALKHNIRFIYASSAATYGDGSLGFSDDHAMLESLQPLNMYGFSKHLFDLWLYRRNLLSLVTGLKYFNVFGPNEYHKGSMVSGVLRMTQQARNTKKIALFASNHESYADGEQKRDFIYVKDAVAMTADFLEKDLFGIYNIGTGKATSWNTLAKAVVHSLQEDIRIEYIPMPKELGGKYQNYTEANMSKAARQGLLLPSWSVETSASDYVQNYLIPGVTW